MANNEKIDLIFITNNTGKTSYFIIERAKFGMAFKEICRVAAQRGSSTTFNYIFTDLSLFQAIITTESFRLIMKATL
ncbi:MAG: hypothetical protein H0V14_00600 [Chitinophagaceae bacterium]|nr:hypothetical protein [Chitinophagaceae bacterium]